jgi:hypothetical protein
MAAENSRRRGEAENALKSTFRKDRETDCFIRFARSGQDNGAVAGIKKSWSKLEVCLLNR